MKFVVIVIPLVEFDICSLKLEYISWSHNSGICNSRIGEVILIGDNITLLDYEHQFMGSLYVVDSRSQTWTLLVIIYIEY